MIHLRRQMQIGLSRTNAVQFDGVLVGNESVFLAMQEEYWTPRLSHQVNISKAFVDNES